MSEEYIRSLLNECIAAAISDELSTEQLIDINETGVPFNPRIVELKRKCDEMRKQLEKCESCFPEKINNLKSSLREISELNRHVAVLDTSFSDLTQKFEKLKNTAIIYRHSVQMKTEQIQLVEEKIKLTDAKYYELKEHANNELLKANTEIANTRKKHEASLDRYKTLFRELEIRYNSSLKNLDLKKKELNSLKAVFDDLHYGGSK